MDAGVKEYLGCRAGEIAIAIASDAVQEVFETRQVTRLPGCPAFMAGIINIRGNVVPVVDLLGVGSRPGDIRKIAVLKTAHGPVGLLISHLIDLMRLQAPSPPEGIPPEVEPVKAGYRGTVRDGAAVFHVLDAQELVAATINRQAL